MVKSGLKFLNDFCASQKRNCWFYKRMILWHLSIVSAIIRNANNREMEQRHSGIPLCFTGVLHLASWWMLVRG